MQIVIDSRENSTVAGEYFSRYTDVEYSITQLKEGDFVLNQSIVFERKTTADFIQSIKDGRLFRQCYQKGNLNSPFILIIEGDKGSLAQTGMTREAIQGALIHLSVFIGVPILRSKDFTETLKLIVLAGRQAEKKDAVNNKQVYLNQRKGRKNNLNTVKSQVLQNLPGVGRARAAELLKVFGSVKNVINATEQELCNVNGIGKQTAKEIKKVVS